MIICSNSYVLFRNSQYRVRIIFTEAFLKRINFSMSDECAQLLKSVCALKGINQGEWIYECVRADFHKRAFEDKQIQQIVLAGTYQPGSNAYSLKKSIQEANKPCLDI
tara:strand:+ start:843 stop:1166 length:324 start_codon:yes stop_codon:yes gene_type:complete